MIRLILCFILLLQWGYSIDVGGPELAEFDLQSIVGIHRSSLIQDYPPSTSNFTVYLDLSEGNKYHPFNVENCPENSQLCAINRLSIPGKDDIISEIVSIPRNLQPLITKLEATGIDIAFSGVQWGSQKLSASIRFFCSRDEGGLKVTKWSKRHLDLQWFTPLACASGQSKKPPPPGEGGGGHENYDNGNDDSSSWGWFTWLFIFMVIIFAGYVIGNAWINANGNGSNEFLNEVVDSLVEVLNRLPSFLKEIWNKIFGNDERGGYSAV